MITMATLGLSFVLSTVIDIFIGSARISSAFPFRWYLSVHCCGVRFPGLLSAHSRGSGCWSSTCNRIEDFDITPIGFAYRGLRQTWRQRATQACRELMGRPSLTTLATSFKSNERSVFFCKTGRVAI